jgi:hypothetical protein
MNDKSIKECLKLLYAIQGELPSNVDSGINTDLTKVILSLESVKCSENIHSTAEILYEALTVIARIAEVTTNLAELIGKFWNN